GELYRDAWDELMKLHSYAAAAQAPPDGSTGKTLASARPLGEHMGEEPVLIIACIALDPGVKDTITTGASMYRAVQNIILTARALGIGSCIAPIDNHRDAQIKELLGIPADVETAALIPLGYPLGKFGRPPRRPLRDVAFTDGWGQAF